MATWAIQTFIVGCLLVIAYFLREFKKRWETDLGALNSKLDSFEKKHERDNKELEERFDKRTTCVEEKCEDLQKELNAYRDHVNKNFTLKDDFIRAVSNIDRKLDKITDLIIERRP